MAVDTLLLSERVLVDKYLAHRKKFGPSYEVLASEYAKDIPDAYKKHKAGHDGPEFHEKFLSATHPHIWSFNLFLEFYLKEMVKSLESVYIDVTSEPNKTDLDVTHFPPECNAPAVHPSLPTPKILLKTQTLTEFCTHAHFDLLLVILAIAS